MNRFLCFQSRADRSFFAVAGGMVKGMAIGAASGILFWALSGSGAIAQETRSELQRDATISQLLDLDQLPLFFSDEPGTLTAASDQLSMRKPSRPSLAWIQDQVGARYGSDRLVAQWRAYRVTGQALAAIADRPMSPGTETSDTDLGSADLESIDLGSADLNYVDVIVNRQIWELLSYFERYAFIAQFGTVAKQYGYHLRVFHSGDVAAFEDGTTANRRQFDNIRGAHVCSFHQLSEPIVTPLEPAVVASLTCEIVFGELGRRQL